MDTDHLLTLDEETYKPPESRVRNAGGIRARIQEMKEADRIRSERRREQQGLIDGNRPWNQQKLKDQGRGDQPNLNLREGEGIADTAKTPYYSLHFRVARFATISCRYGTQAQRNLEWSEKISNRFHTMLDSWEDHDYNVQLRDWQMCVFGIGLAVWEDEVNPFWEPHKIGDVLVPDKTRSNINRVPEAVILRGKNPVDLFTLIKNEGAAKTQGWLPDRAKKAIVNTASLEIRNKWGSQWGEQYQASLRRGDVLWNAKDFEIPLADHLVIEFSGRVTHSIMLDAGGTGNSSGKAKTILDEDDDDLLFRKIGRFECFSQIMCPFFFDIGTGEWHSVKGLGPKIFDFCQISNRMFCNLLAGATAASGLILKPKDGQATIDTQLVQINGAVVIPPSYDVEQHRIADNMQGPLNVRKELQGVLQNNIGQYMQRMSAENAEPTLGQAQLNYQQQGQLGDAARDRHLKSEDRCYLEMCRRALKLGKKLHNRKPDGLNWYEKLVNDFYEGCIEDEVPEEALDFKNVISVKATRGIGNGSPVSMDLSTQQLMGLIPMAPERGRRHILRLRSAFLAGQGNADVIFPPFEDADVPDSNVWAATIENIAFTQPNAEPIPVTDDQDNAIHFGKHFQGASEAVNALKAGQMEPVAVLGYLHNLGPHMKAHLDKMAGDPTRKQQIAPMQEAWLTLSKIADQLQQQIEEAAKAEQGQQQQPQIDPQFLLDMKRLEEEMQIKRMKVAGDLQLKSEKQAVTLRMKDIQTAHTMRTETAKAAKTEPELAPAA